MASSMNGLTKSEHKVLKYLQFAFPGYAWCKTAGKGMLDFMGRPPADKNLPMLFVESKCGNDRARDSQSEWAKSDFGVGCCKYVVYTPDDSSAWCVLYTWDDWLLFVEHEDVVARAERKSKEKRATTEQLPGMYQIARAFGSARMCVLEDGTCLVQKDSMFRAEETPSVPTSTHALRSRLIQDGSLMPEAGCLKLMRDTEFTSTSAAASAVLGCSASGPFEWKPVSTELSAN